MKKVLGILLIALVLSGCAINEVGDPGSGSNAQDVACRMYLDNPTLYNRPSGCEEPNNGITGNVVAEQPTYTLLPPMVEPTHQPCAIDHPFFPIRLGAYWDFRGRTIQNGRDYGWHSGTRFEVTELTSNHAIILEYMTVGLDAGPENWNQEFEIRCDNRIPGFIWGFPSSVYVLPYVLSPNSSYNWPLPPATPTKEFQAVGWRTVTVPAGTFDVLCVAFDVPGETRTNYVSSGMNCFAEGVGYVYGEYHALDSGGTIGDGFHELESYSIPPE